MKKLMFLALAFCASNLFSQSNQSYFLGAGYSENGGFAFSIGLKNKNSFGVYVAARGINSEGDYFSGVDYSSISTERILLTIREEKPAFGMNIGTIYNLRDSNFSIGAGLGYGVKQTLVREDILYDFQYIKDERATRFTAEKQDKITFEAFLDYSFKKSLSNSFGLQIGYNSLNSVTGIFYYSF